MTNLITVYAVPGRLVRDPRTRDTVTAAGATLPANDFWYRRIADGDVTLTPPVVEVVEVVADGEVEVVPLAQRKSRRG